MFPELFAAQTSILTALLMAVVISDSEDGSQDCLLWSWFGTYLHPLDSQCPNFRMRRNCRRNCRAISSSIWRLVGSSWGLQVGGGWTFALYYFHIVWWTPFTWFSQFRFAALVCELAWEILHLCQRLQPSPTTKNHKRNYQKTLWCIVIEFYTFLLAGWLSTIVSKAVGPTLHYGAWWCSLNPVVWGTLWLTCPLLTSNSKTTLYCYQLPVILHIASSSHTSMLVPTGPTRTASEIDDAKFNLLRQNFPNCKRFLAFIIFPGYGMCGTASCTHTHTHITNKGFGGMSSRTRFMISWMRQDLKI